MNADETRRFLLDCGCLEPIEIHFAEYVANLAEPSRRSETWLLAALTARSASKGDSAFSIASISGKRVADIFGRLGADAVSDDPTFPELDPQRIAADSAAVGRPGEMKPIVFDDELFYLHKFHAYEEIVADFIGKRVASPDRSAIGESALLSMLGNVEKDEIDWQKAAATLSLRNSFLIVSGGPGTGKTTTAAVMLALAVERNPDISIKLVAPTGRAAERLGESIRIFKTENADSLPEEIALAMPDEAETIHRFLGIGSRRPRFDRNRKAPVDLLLVDEASMVSLWLFARLFEVYVERFSIGFGKVVWSKTVDGTEYALSAIPLGGYVKMKGQDDSDPTKVSCRCTRRFIVGGPDRARTPRVYSSRG